MSRPGDTPGPDALEWAGRGLVGLQFGVLAAIGWRAWVSSLPGGVLTMVLLAASAGLALWTLAANRPGNFNIRPTPRHGAKLVMEGPYRWVRHPMYTSVLLAAAGAGVMSQQLLDALLWLVLLAVLAAKAVIEERALVQRFPAYPLYKTRTTRFLPWLV